MRSGRVLFGMLKPLPMLKLEVLVAERHASDVCLALGRAGFVHLLSAPEQSPGRLLQAVSRTDVIRRLERLAQQACELRVGLGLPETLDDAVAGMVAGAFGPADPAGAGAAAVIEPVGKRVQEGEETLKRLAGETEALTRTLNLLEACPFLAGADLRRLRQVTHLYAAFGMLPAGSVTGVASRLSGGALFLAGKVMADGCPMLALTARRDGAGVDAVLASAGFKALPLPEPPAAAVTGAEARAVLRARLAVVKQEEHSTRRELAQLAAAADAGLAVALARLRFNLATLRAEQEFGQAGGLMMISGWIPAERREDALRVVSAAAHDAAVVACRRPEEDERVRTGVDTVPSRLGGPALLEPFRELLAMYGLPRYDEIAPTPFVAAGFLLMFGLMFGDVGQGLLLAVSGTWLWRWCRAGGRRRLGRMAGQFLVMTGLASTGFGFLYGSVFGREDLIRHHWLQPMTDVMALFAAAIGVGVLCISLGIALNMVNRFAARRWFDGVFDRSGLLGLLFYWSCLGLAFAAWRGGGIRGWIPAVAAAPLLLLALREPLRRRLFRAGTVAEGGGEAAEGLAAGVMTAGMEVFEALTTFLGNTMSFVRLGAFALSHAALGYVIQVLGGMALGLPAGVLWVVLIVLAGNLLVLAEGVVVAIQATRLQYYEFFSRFYSGNGIAFRPFILNSRSHEG